MSGPISFARMKELAKRKQDGSSSSKPPQTPPPAAGSEPVEETTEGIATPRFRPLEEAGGSPVDDLVPRKRSKLRRVGGSSPSPMTGEIGVVDLDLEEDSPPHKRSRLSKETHKKPKSPKPFSLETFIKKNYEEYCSDPFDALAQLLKHGSDLHAALKQEAEMKVKAANDERDEAMRLVDESKKTLEKTLAALEKAKKEKEDLELEKNQALQDKLDLNTRVEEAEKKASQAETDLATSITSVSTLRVQVADLESQLIERTKAKDAEISDIADQACQLAEQAFANALAQVAVLHPNITLDKKILKPDHEVREGKIGKPSADGKEFIIVETPPYP